MQVPEKRWEGLLFKLSKLLVGLDSIQKLELRLEISLWGSGLENFKLRGWKNPLELLRGRGGKVRVGSEYLREILEVLLELEMRVALAGEEEVFGGWGHL